MSDSGSSSDSEDFEYIPEGDVGRSDSEASVGGEEEEKTGVSTASALGTKRRRERKRAHQSSHTRKSRSRPDSVKEGMSREEEEGEEEDGEEREREKARVDDLWASFKEDAALQKRKENDAREGSTGAVCSKDNSGLKVETKMVKIQKTYDFAGDEVVVEEEVAADSKEARETAGTDRGSVTTATTSDRPLSSPASSSATVSGATRRKPAITSASGSLLAGKKLSGISSVLQSLSKKPKISTLEKSKLDWNQFKADEGLEHELSQQRKDSYLEKQEFLQRSDVRQYELEREERLKKYRRLH